MAKKDQAILDGTPEGEMLTRLTERVEKAVATMGQLRKERDELRKKLDAAEKKLSEQETGTDERAEIRNRIESVLKSLESLEE